MGAKELLEAAQAVYALYGELIPEAEAGYEPSFEALRPAIIRLRSEIMKATSDIHKPKLPRVYNGHIAEVHENCTRHNCPVCEGGLFICAACGKAEAELSEPCHGRTG